MSTDLQRDLAEALVNNTKLPRYKRKNKGQLLVAVGYSIKLAKANPTKIIEQKGVKDAIREMGLTEELITTALVEDIKNKPQKRLGELSLGAEILNMKEEKQGNTFNTIIFNDDQSAEIARRRLASDRPSKKTSD